MKDLHRVDNCLGCSKNNHEKAKAKILLKLKDSDKAGMLTTQEKERTIRFIEGCSNDEISMLVGIILASFEIDYDTLLESMYSALSE